MTEDILKVGDWLLYGGFPAVAAFTILYGFRSKWWLYPESRALLAKSASLMLVTVSVGFTLLFGPDYPGRAWVRLFCFGYFFWASWWLVVRLLLSQHASRKVERALYREFVAARVREDVPLTERRAGRLDRLRERALDALRK